MVRVAGTSPDVMLTRKRVTLYAVARGVAALTRMIKCQSELIVSGACIPVTNRRGRSTRTIHEEPHFDDCHHQFPGPHEPAGCGARPVQDFGQNFARYFTPFSELRKRPRPFLLGIRVTKCIDSGQSEEKKQKVREARGFGNYGPGAGEISRSIYSAPRTRIGGPELHRRRISDHN